MVGALILLVAASVPTVPPPTSSRFQPRSTATAHATARIQVISGVKFGQDYHIVPPSALRRSASLTEADGQVSAAELLEFQ
jgi:hypothetical protein